MMSRSGNAVRFSLLGAVEVRAGDRVLDAGPPQLRHVLTVLAAEAGRPVTAEALIDRVWDEAPAAARHTLHVYITRLRRLLEQITAADGTCVALVRRSGGYVLEIEPEHVDVHRFRHLVDRAGEPGCPDEQRAVLLREAAGLWRGPPLAGLPGGWAQRMRQAWGQEHLDAVVAWANAELRLGNPSAVIGPLTALAEEHPFAESVAGVLIRALYAAGRAGDALQRYELVRQRLAEELGTDPSADLQRLHQGILRGENLNPAPSQASIRFSAQRTPPVVPAQLPADVTGFTGRRKHLARLDDLVTVASAQPTAVVISAIAGTAGVGKTALAVHCAHRVREYFPDGQLYVNLRGFDPGGSVMDPAEAVRGFLDALGVAPQRIPATLDAQAALYRSLLADRRMLILIDNARDPDHARPLLPATPGCLALVTSRNQLTSLVAAEGAHPITLDLLTHEEARQLLSRRLGSDRVAAEPVAVDHIVTRCARLPLALAIVAAHAATQPHRPLTVLADQLRNARDRLDPLTTGDPTTDVRRVFSWSYRHLTPAAAKLFRLLGLHPGPDTSLPAAASLTCLSPIRVRPLLAELTRVNLVTEHTQGRYTLHDLLRAYAAEQTHTYESGTDRHAAIHRILDHYLHTAYAADRLLDPTRDPITLTPPQPGVTPEHLADHEQALAWFTAEHPVLLAAVDHAATTRFDTHTWQLAWTLDDFLDRRGHWHDWAATGRAAVAAAGRLADPTAQARAHRHLARAYTRLGRLDDAHTTLRHALDLYRRAGDLVGQATTQHNLSAVWERQGRHAEALDHERQALDLYRAAGHRHGQANALNGVGWCHALLGDHRQALTSCQQALILLQELDDRPGQAPTWDSLGYAHHHLGHYTRAITCYQHALDLYRNLGDRHGESIALTHLGDTHHATGDPQIARDAWQQALIILDQLNHPDADEVRTKLATLNRPTNDDVG